MSPIKEPHFFTEPADGLADVRDRIGDVGEYQRLFCSRLRVRGEASTSYSHFPARRGVAERIRLRVPDAKILYLVRDPIARLVSHYCHQVAYEGERRALEIAVGDVYEPVNIYVCASRYGTQLRRYLRVFPPENILVVDQAELRQHRAATLAEIFDFLDVDPNWSSPAFQEELASTEQRRQYPRWYGEVRGRRRLRYLPAAMRRPLRRIAEMTETAIWPKIASPEMPADVRQRLAELFAPEVEELRMMTGKRFGTWSL